MGQREQNSHAACLNYEGIVNHAVTYRYAGVLVYNVTGENKERSQMITIRRTKLREIIMHVLLLMIPFFSLIKCEMDLKKIK